MAFDQGTRNRLQKFVSESRDILTEEFTRQLQATYGLDPKYGTVAEIETLTFLDNKGRQTAIILRETLAHYAAAIPGKSEKERTKQALDRIIREQAFTVLNRLGALRMAEARGFLLESIAKGYSSKGFQLYKNLAGSALGETGDAYRCFLFSLFDEFSLDLAVLFDRHSAQGRLFPREAALLALLEQINHFEIEHLWAEDETIGWIYQYFNSQEERKKMRAESQAPRNSRELAVRNQFFTPRYVVEFLTDNTLGRIWYEMTQGKTALVESCRYLVRRPTEIFLAKGETAPKENSETQDSLSQEELLKQPVYIPFRPLKDPRELRMLDPACGSMHFGLYAFDLFEKIYEEAWQLETDLGVDAFERSKELHPLQTTYSCFEEFQKDIPKLIIEQNIHGVDIDPRAVQIAGLSLWQRAQRAWHQMGIKPNQRPVIKKSNIVCAEPMPGEMEMLQEFTAKLNPPVLGQLVGTIFERMELAGEAGTLLKIEEEIKTAISEAKETFNKEMLRQKREDGYLPGMAPKRQPTIFDFAELHNQTDFWDTAEEQILDALSGYAEQAESNDGRKRLFAEDAARGFAFIDLCRKRFDVVLMNPPYGAPSNTCKEYLGANFPTIWIEIYIAFCVRMMTLCPKGYIGSLTSRTWMYLQKFCSFRENVITNNALYLLIDFGAGVLDGAAVETAAYILKADSICKYSTFYDLNDANRDNLIFDKETAHFSDDCSDFSPIVRDISIYADGKNFPLKYKGDIEKANVVSANDLFEAKPGLGTRDDFRFIRLWWELPLAGEDSRSWKPIAFGGKGTHFYANHNTYVNWAYSGKELKAFIEKNYGSASRSIVNEKYYYKPGVTYQYTGNTFRAHFMPKGMIISMAGQGLYAKQEHLFPLIGLLNTRRATYELKQINPGRFFQASYVNSLVFDASIIDNFQRLETISKIAVSAVFELLSKTETSLVFNPSSILKDETDFEQQNQSLISDYQKSFTEIETLSEIAFPNAESFAHKDKNLPTPKWGEISHAVGFLFGRWTDESMKLGKKTFQEDEAFPDIPKTIGISNSLSSDKSYPGIISGEENDSNGLAVRILNLIERKDFIRFIRLSSRDDVENYFKKNFFSEHLEKYTENKRQAPIYWPLQTSTCSYTLWVYYHSLTEQTLYACVNDFVDPRLKSVADDLNSLRSNSARSGAEENELAKLSDLEVELKEFRDELLRIAKFWKPNLNDGVQITAAPLWKLFQHRPWQKKLKEIWESLEKGDFDWAHLAYSLWPERVLRKCHEDRSLAIAHDVEADFWEKIELSTNRRGKSSGLIKTEWQPRKLTENQLTELIRQKLVGTS